MKYREITMHAHPEIECEIGDTIRLGDGVEIKIMRTVGHAARIGIGAPANVRITRKELLDAMQKKNRPRKGGSGKPAGPAG